MRFLISKRVIFRKFKADKQLRGDVQVVRYRGAQVIAPDNAEIAEKGHFETETSYLLRQLMRYPG